MTPMDNVGTKANGHAKNKVARGREIGHTEAGAVDREGPGEVGNGCVCLVPVIVWE